MTMMILIAELCQNHNGSEDTLWGMLDNAVESGATHVKIQHIYSKNYKLLLANVFSTTFIIIQFLCLIFNDEYFYFLFFIIAISFNLFDFIKSLFFSEKIIRNYNLNYQYALLNSYN